MRADAEPTWWLNLQAHPEASVNLADGRPTVRGRVAEGAERSRLWAWWREVDTNEIDTNEIDTNEIDTNEIDTNLDAYAAFRSAVTAVVILGPSPDSDG